MPRVFLMCLCLALSFFLEVEASNIVNLKQRSKSPPRQPTPRAQKTQLGMPPDCGGESLSGACEAFSVVPELPVLFLDDRSETPETSAPQAVNPEADVVEPVVEPGAVVEVPVSAGHVLGPDTAPVSGASVDPFPISQQPCEFAYHVK